jgi:hypothetical protein
MNPDIGVSALKSAGILKGTDPLTIAAAQAPIRFNEYDFHLELTLLALGRWRKKAPQCTKTKRLAGLVLEAISKIGFWFKVAAGPSVKPEEYWRISRI